MDRRAFFRRGIQRLGQAATREAMRKAEKRARRWIRPPFALDELEFLLACTRCSACIDSCPHQVLFRLPARCGASVAGTPAMDLLNHACHLCADWPCVAACESASLGLPEEDGEGEGWNQDDVLPWLAVAWVDQDRCLPYQGPECGACAGSCPVDGALAWRGARPIIDAEYCQGCALCREACIAEPKAISVAARGKSETAA